MYKEKYLKYKTKYLDLKTQIGGQLSTTNNAMISQMKGGTYDDPPSFNIKIDFPHEDKNVNLTNFLNFIDPVLKYILYSLYCIVNCNSKDDKKLNEIFLTETFKKYEKYGNSATCTSFMTIIYGYLHLQEQITTKESKYFVNPHTSNIKYLYNLLNRIAETSWYNNIGNNYNRYWFDTHKQFYSSYPSIFLYDDKEFDNTYYKPHPPTPLPTTYNPYYDPDAINAKEAVTKAISTAEWMEDVKKISDAIIAAITPSTAAITPSTATLTLSNYANDAIIAVENASKLHSDDPSYSKNFTHYIEKAIWDATIAHPRYIVIQSRRIPL